MVYFEQLRKFLDNIKEIINRLKQHYMVKNNKELSKVLGISYDTLNTWIKRKKMPLEVIRDIVQSEQISYDWVIDGKKSHEENTSKGRDKVKVKGDGNTTLTGNININTAQFNHSEDIEEIINLLQYAPAEFLSIVKDKLKKYKEITHL